MIDFLKKALHEAFDGKIADKGTVQFSKSSLSDPHIKKLIKHVSDETNIPVSTIEDHINDKLSEFAELEKKSPILYNTAMQNLVESEVFNLIWRGDNKPEMKMGKDGQPEVKMPLGVPGGHFIKGAPKFSERIFHMLVRMVKTDHDQFFPLRNFIDHKYEKNERIILIPSDKAIDKHLNSVDTAAATEKAEFAFNVNFMQHLLDFAYIKGVKAKGKKYKSNGGDIPDEYAYIEFLIIHEFMHFTYADFHYQKILKESPKITNYVGDFRTNYLLVKSGYEQLPLGLFSDDINYDRQKTYKEMVDVVKREMAKLSDPMQEKLNKMFEGWADDHGNPGGEGDPADGTPHPAEGKSTDDIDKRHKEIEKRMNDRKDSGKDDVKPQESNASGTSDAQKGGTGARTKNGEGSKFDYSKVKPKYSWLQLLKRLLSDISTEVDETYQKPNKRNIRNLDIARQTGAGVIKPGEVPAESKKVKIAFVVDSSGSMTGAIAKVYANIDQLFKKNKKLVNTEFFLIKFSSDHDIYRCNIGRQSYVKVENVKEKGSGSESGSIKELFSKHIGSSTNFTMDLVMELEKLAAMNYNIIVITDTDLMYGENQPNFLHLWAKAKKQTYIMADSRHTYVALIQAMKQVASNITYIDE